MSDDAYVITKIEIFNSRHGGIAYEIFMVNIGMRKEFHTYIDPTNKNFKYWQPITANPEHGHIITNLKVKKGNLISADSVVEAFVEPFQTRDAAMKAVKKIWARQDEGLL